MAPDAARDVSEIQALDTIAFPLDVWRDHLVDLAQEAYEQRGAAMPDIAALLLLLLTDDISLIQGHGTEMSTTT